MTVIVTGGAGFIGSMVSNKLLEEGEKVVVLDNFENGKREFLEPRGTSTNLELVTIDIRNADKISEIISDIRPERLFHLAALHFIPYCNDHPQETIETNITGTLNVFQACRVFPPEMVIFASTAAVYPIRDELNREDSEVGPSDIYGISKLAGEELAKLYVAQTGGSCIAARIFNAVGKNETNPHLVPHLVEQLLAGKDTVELGNLEPFRDYIDTTDLANGLIAMSKLRNTGFDVFNVSGDSEYSVRQVVAICETILNRPIQVLQRADLKRKVERLHLRASIEKLIGATHWTPVISLQETLEGLILGTDD